MRCAITLIPLVLVFANGCGGDDKPKPTPELSTAELIQRADKLCDDEATLAGLVPASLGTEDSLDGVAKAYENTATAIDSSTDELEALTPPRQDRFAVDHWLATRRQQARLLRDDIAPAVRDGDLATLKVTRSEMAQLEATEFRFAVGAA